MFAYLVNWFSVGEVKANFTLNNCHVLVGIISVDTFCTSILNVSDKYFVLKSRLKDEIISKTIFLVGKYWCLHRQDSFFV
jgi:hypothetical protein